MTQLVVTKRFAASVVLLTGVIGCAPLHRLHEAAIVWQATAAAYRDLPGIPKTGTDSRHYTKGWKQGYFEVANGGSSAPPAVAPRYYWGLKFKTSEGRRSVDTWFRGYVDGAAAAIEDGWSDFDYVPTAEPVETLILGDSLETDSPVVPARPAEESPLPAPVEELSGVTGVDEIQRCHWYLRPPHALSSTATDVPSTLRCQPGCIDNSEIIRRPR